jgi:hypothetical protein
MTPSTHIRTLFLHPKPTYSPTEAANLLDIPLAALLGFIDAGELEPIDTNAVPVLPWPELASFATDFWSQEAVEQALGEKVIDILPELVRLTDLHVRLPRFEVTSIERLSARDGLTVDTVLTRELRDLASAHSDWLTDEVPGFAEALAWP